MAVVVRSSWALIDRRRKKRVARGECTRTGLLAVESSVTETCRHEGMSQNQSYLVTPVFFRFRATVIEVHRDSTVQTLQDRFNEMRLAAYSDMMRKIAATKIFCGLRQVFPGCLTAPAVALALPGFGGRASCACTRDLRRKNEARLTLCLVGSSDQPRPRFRHEWQRRLIESLVSQEYCWRCLRRGSFCFRRGAFSRGKPRT